MMTSDAPTPQPRRTSRLWGWFRRTVLVLVCILVPAYFIYWGWMEVVASQGRAELEKAIAETDAAYPGWRWDDLVAARKTIPDEENAWLVVEKIAEKRLDWLETPVLVDGQAITYVPATVANQLLRADTRLVLSRLQDPSHADQLSLARSLANYPRGQRPRSTARPTYDWGAEQQASTGTRPSERYLSVLLEHMVEDSLDQNKPHDAANSIQSLLHIAGCYRDSSDFLTWQRQHRLRQQATLRTARLTGLCDPSADTLKLLQDKFQAEWDATGSSALVALRAERAAWFGLMEDLRTGKMSLSQHVSNNTTPNTTSWLISRGLSGHFQYLLPAQETQLLRWFNEAEEIATKINQKQLASWEQLAQQIQQVRSQEGSNFGPFRFHHQASMSLLRWGRHLEEDSARLSTTIAGLACERFRVAEKRWPKTLEELVPRYLKEIPHELNGQPLNLEMVPDGIRIGSSVRIDSFEEERIHFRLWNPDQRRLPAVALDEPGKNEQP